MRSVVSCGLIVLGFIAGCRASAASTEGAVAAAPREPSAGSERAPAAPPSPAASAETPVALRVYTLMMMMSSGTRTRGRWYRQGASGWESATCATSQISDPRAGTGHAPPMCEAWAAVPAEQLPALARAREYAQPHNNEIECANAVEICAGLGLAPQTMGPQAGMK